MTQAFADALRQSGPIRSEPIIVEKVVEGEKPVEIELPDPVKSVNSVNLQILQAKRSSKKLEKALEWLQKHPEHLNTPSREIADLIGVSHTTVHKAQQVMKGTSS